MGQNARSLLNALMDNCRTLAYHSGYSPTPLFNCPNDLLQQHGHILFLYAFIKNLYKWSEAKGIHAYTPNIRRLFNAELLEQAQSDDPNSRSNVDVNNGPLNRVKELVEKHFYFNVQFSRNMQETEKNFRLHPKYSTRTSRILILVMMKKKFKHFNLARPRAMLVLVHFHQWRLVLMQRA